MNHTPKALNRIIADVRRHNSPEPDGLTFINGEGETVHAPIGCDGLCRINCEAHDPEHAFCQEQICSPFAVEIAVQDGLARLLELGLPVLDAEAANKEVVRLHVELLKRQPEIDRIKTLG